MNALRDGVLLFNEHRFWDAHEAWEPLWLRSSGEEKRFVQGLIQLAAAYHHVQRGTLSGGLRLFAAAEAKLARSDEGYLGVSFHAALDAARVQAAKLAAGKQIEPDEWPKLGYN